MKFSLTVDIEAAPEQVFYWLDDPNRAMQWMTSVTESKIIHETPGRIGTTFRECVEENGRFTELHGVMTDYRPNERLAFDLEGDFNRSIVDFTLEERGAITRLTQHIDVRFKGLLFFLAPLFKRHIMQQARSEFARLKELCEADAQGGNNA